jgi:DNA repair protein RadC
MEVTSNSIRMWAEDDKPREKLVLKGREALSDAELIAILLGSGTRELSAVGLAQQLLRSVDYNLNAFGKLRVEQLQKFKGIGVAKAVTLVAALELGRRRRVEEALLVPTITSSRAVFDIMHPILCDLPHEEFWILALNNSHKVIHKFQLSKGGITGTVVDLRILFRSLFDCNAVAFIMVHNHPSGALHPSEADVNLTIKVKDASRHLDVRLMDHLIITTQNYYSFSDDNKL